MRRLTPKSYRWLRRIGAGLGAVGGVVALLLASAAEDAAFARAGTHRVDVSPFALPTYLALGVLVGWTLTVLMAHFADVVPLNATQAPGE